MAGGDPGRSVLGRNVRGTDEGTEHGEIGRPTSPAMALKSSAI
jgi:hypothetical protein